MNFKFFYSFWNLIIFSFIFRCFLFYFILSNEILSLLIDWLLCLLLYTLFRFIHGTITNIRIHQSTTLTSAFHRTAPDLTSALRALNFRQFRIKPGLQTRTSIILYIILTQIPLFCVIPFPCTSFLCLFFYFIRLNVFLMGLTGFYCLYLLVLNVFW